MEVWLVWIIVVYSLIAFVAALVAIFARDGHYWVPGVFRREICLRPLYPLVVLWPAILWPLVVAGCLVFAAYKVLFGPLRPTGDARTCCGIPIRPGTCRLRPGPIWKACERPGRTTTTTKTKTKTKTTKTTKTTPGRKKTTSGAAVDLEAARTQAPRGEQPGQTSAPPPRADPQDGAVVTAPKPQTPMSSTIWNDTSSSGPTMPPPAYTL